MFFWKLGTQREHALLSPDPCFPYNIESPTKAPAGSQCLREKDLGIRSQDCFVWEICPRKYLAPEGPRVSSGSSLSHDRKVPVTALVS